MSRKHDYRSEGGGAVAVIVEIDLAKVELHVLAALTEKGNQMSLSIACPICDAAAGEPCYDPHGRLPHKDQHDARFKAGLSPELRERLDRLDRMDRQRPPESRET